MAHLIDKSALVAEIERLMNRYDSEYDEDSTEVNAAKGNVCHEILCTIDNLEVKEVQKVPESIWHDANHQPTMYRKYLVRYSDGRVSGSWERHDDGFIPWKDVVKEHGFTHWCYVEDLIKL